MFVTAADVKAKLKDAMARATGDGLLVHWDSVIDRATTFAYWEIVSALSGRGYSRAVIDAWERGAEFQMDLAVHRCFQDLRRMHPDQYSGDALLATDRRPELRGDPSKGIAPVEVTVGGEFKHPDTTVGQVTTGRMDDSTDLFVPYDPGDERRGVVTQW